MKATLTVVVLIAGLVIAVSALAVQPKRIVITNTAVSSWLREHESTCTVLECRNPVPAADYYRYAVTESHKIPERAAELFKLCPTAYYEERLRQAEESRAALYLVRYRSHDEIKGVVLTVSGEEASPASYGCGMWYIRNLLKRDEPNISLLCDYYRLDLLLHFTKKGA